jgi:hypothetical protein
MINTKKKTKGFEFWVQLDEIEKIKKYIKNLGFLCISDESSDSPIYQKNGNIVNIKKKLEKVKEFNGGIKIE